MGEDYRKVAKRLGTKYLFGRWSIQILPRDPAGNIYKLFSIVPLDGWITDPHEIKQAMMDDPAFDVIIEQKPSELQKKGQL